MTGLLGNVLSISFLCSGFRSSFDRGILSLWFNFRRNVSIRLLPIANTQLIIHRTQFYRK
jgi:hypothetical protein